jgi:hypothetical protein
MAYDARMNGVIGDTTYSFGDLAGLNWSFATGEPWGLWVTVGISTLLITGILMCALKGKYGFLLVALLVPGLGVVLSVIGGVRLAKPRSFWAHHMYDRKTMAQAIARFEPPIDLERYPERKLRKGYSRPLNRPSTDHVG